MLLRPPDLRHLDAAFQAAGLHEATDDLGVFSHLERGTLQPEADAGGELRTGDRSAIDNGLQLCANLLRRFTRQGAAFPLQATCGGVGGELLTSLDQ